jgi:anti-sigma factor RsiW
VVAPKGACPSDAELAQFLDRRLDVTRARRLEAHFDRCTECRELVYMLAGLDPEKA